jgi:hypothetical protein
MGGWWGEGNQAESGAELLCGFLNIKLIQQLIHLVEIDPWFKAKMVWLDSKGRGRTLLIAFLGLPTMLLGHGVSIYRTLRYGFACHPGMNARARGGLIKPGIEIPGYRR